MLAFFDTDEILLFTVSEMFVVHHRYSICCSPLIQFFFFITDEIFVVHNAMQRSFQHLMSTPCARTQYSAVGLDHPYNS